MLNCAACKQCYPVPRLRSWETCIQAAVCWPQHADGHLWEGDSSQHGVQRWVTASRDLGMSLDWCFSVFTLWLHHIPDVFVFELISAWVHRRGDSRDEVTSPVVVVWSMFLGLSAVGKNLLEELLWSVTWHRSQLDVSSAKLVVLMLDLICVTI